MKQLISQIDPRVVQRFVTYHSIYLSHTIPFHSLGRLFLGNKKTYKCHYLEISYDV